MPVLAPSHVNLIRASCGKPRPVTQTVVPTTPRVAESVIDGPEASVAAEGTAYTASEANMMNVASHAATRVAPARRWFAAVSGTQSVPFQNVIRHRLHSATRLTQGVPWLCGPASRRVCYFVEAGRLRTVSQAFRWVRRRDRRDRLGGTHDERTGRDAVGLAANSYGKRGPTGYP